MWMHDFAPWDVELPLIPGSNGGDGTPYMCQIPVMIEGKQFLVRLVRADRSDGHWNFYEKERCHGYT